MDSRSKIFFDKLRIEVKIQFHQWGGVPNDFFEFIGRYGFGCIVVKNFKCRQIQSIGGTKTGFEGAEFFK